MRAFFGLLAVQCLLTVVPGAVQAEEPTPVDAEMLAGLSLRGIGPALMGGRIADIAIDPTDRRIWYAAVGSGGVWKTENAGTTWKPIFDDQPSYSIGCVTLDPSNSNVVWVGTGENVSGRHVGWGDGVYKSLDAGATWTQMGLEQSEHLGDIVVHPEDGDVVWVAAEGPLWASGGQRGVYKTTDGGHTWSHVLAIDDDTGVTDLELDPRDPDTLYAASYQRRRHVWSLLAGGPGSGLHKSTDGGATWRRLVTGLPAGDMGKIGLAVSPADPDVVYATIEADEETRGFYRSQDRGERWERRSGYISNGTGPHYYQEIVASPHDVDRVYQMDVFLHITRDGGASFMELGTGREKHSDNHALVVDPAHPDHLIAGTDGGLYETWDHGDSWRHFGNVPISQFYKLAVDNASPFYNVLAGAQDLGTLLGPARTKTTEGVRNSDWSVPLGADGYACAFDPFEAHFLYMEWQGGNLVRFDQRSREAVDIKPQPAPGEPPERWNWDAPVVASEHRPGRLYFGSHRLWQSDDRGDAWQALSGDLTRSHIRYELPLMGRVQSVDALYDNGAMSWFSTLTSIAESPLEEALLYVGSDDGLVQASEDGGESWRPAAAPSGVPELAFVNDVLASRHDVDRVFAAFDAHKLGDFRPLLFVSDDRGRRWRSIAGDPEAGGLPADAIVWSVVEDHEVPGLLFAGTERGLFVSLDSGNRWTALRGGVPPIALRDLAVQRRDGDLIAASFGRGLFVLDDYAPLRALAVAGGLTREATLFPVRRAWWFVPFVPTQAGGAPSQGSAAFASPNPPHGAVFTYALTTDSQSPRERRNQEEATLVEQGDDVVFPGWETLRAERRAATSKVLLTVRNAAGEAVRRLEGPSGRGFHRVSWDLRSPPVDPVDLEPPGFQPPWVTPPHGPLVGPGRYTVSIIRVDESGAMTPLDGPQPFDVVSVSDGSDEGIDHAASATFRGATSELLRAALAASNALGDAEDRLRHLAVALTATPGAAPALFTSLRALEESTADISLALRGDPVRGDWNEPRAPTVLDRLYQIAGGHWDTRAAPTATQRQSLDTARTAFASVRSELTRLLDTDLPAFEAVLENVGAPWTPGRRLPPG